VGGGVSQKVLCGQSCVGHSEVVAGNRALQAYQDWFKSQAQPGWQELIRQAALWVRVMPAVVSWCANNEAMVCGLAQGGHAIAAHNNASAGCERR